jgi:DNA repair protein RecO (recombination protein O)
MLESLDAIVLHQRNYSESHKIVELFTAEHGRISVLARGARASRRRFAGVLDLFAHIQAEVKTSGSLWTLTGAELIAGRFGLRGNLDAFQAASTLCETVRLLCPEHYSLSIVYGALCDGLSALDSAQFSRATEFYSGILRATGILPDAEHCCRCGISPLREARLDTRHGGLACPNCEHRSKPLSELTLTALRTGHCEDEVIAKELDEVLQTMVEFHVGRPLRSRMSLTA